MFKRFYGCGKAKIEPVNETYPGIRTPEDLYAALSEIWCKYSCTPRLRASWTPDNMTLGQCSITAFVAQDIFGGKVYGIPVGGGSYHCFNVVGDTHFDLTSGQFGNRFLNYQNCEEQSREKHFEKSEKRERYEYLCRELKRICRERQAG